MGGACARARLCALGGGWCVSSLGPVSSRGSASGRWWKDWPDTWPNGLGSGPEGVGKAPGAQELAVAPACRCWRLHAAAPRL